MYNREILMMDRDVAQNMETVIKNLHETYQCRMYSRELLMMGRELVQNMETVIKNLHET
jgi:hypothetical protein